MRGDAVLGRTLVVSSQTGLRGAVLLLNVPGGRQLLKSALGWCFVPEFQFLGLRSQFPNSTRPRFLRRSITFWLTHVGVDSGREDSKASTTEQHSLRSSVSSQNRASHHTRSSRVV